MLKNIIFHTKTRSIKTKKPLFENKTAIEINL